MRHLSCRILWLQGLVANGTIKLACVAGATNPADIGTKHLLSSRLRSLMAMLGMFNKSTGLFEGSDDPGRIYPKKQNLLSILSVLNLVQLKGCNNEDVSEAAYPGLGLLAFTVVLCLLFIFLWMCLRNTQQQNVEPDAEPGTLDDPLILDDLDEAATLNGPPPSSSARGSEPNARRLYEMVG